MSDSDSHFVTSTFRKGKGTADLGGWDTIYAIRTPILNEALLRHFADKPDALRFHHEQDGCVMEGAFGPWQITSGGSGRHVHLHLPLISGTATITGLGAPLVYDLSQASAFAEVTLGFHPVGPKPDSTAVKAELRINGRHPAPSAGNAATVSRHKKGAPPADKMQTITTASKTPPAPPEPPVTVRPLVGIVKQGDPSPLDSVAPTLLSGFLATWLLDHAEIFDFAFLSVDIATEASKTMPWLAPTHVGYAISHPMHGKEQTEDVEHSIFAIMAMTEGRDPDGAADTLTPNAIPLNEGVNAGFLISPKLILEKFLLPGLPALFGAKPDDFVVGANGKSVSNCADLHLKLELENSAFLGSNPVPATITVGNFNLTLNDTYLTQEFQEITFPYGTKDELSVQMSLSGHSQLGIDANKHFALQMEPNPRATLSAQPDQRTVAMEQLIAMGVTLVLMIGTSFLFARMAGSAKNVVRAGKTVTQAETVAQVEAQTVAKAETTAAEMASGAASGTARTVSVEVATEANVLSSNTVTAELVETTAAEMQAGGTCASAGFFERFCAKTLTMMLAQMVSQMAGQAIGNLSNFDLLSLYKNDPKKLPTLADFGSHCIAPMSWPRTQGATLMCAGLNGALVLGFALESAPQSTPASQA